MKNKSEVSTHFHHFRCFIENLFNAKIKFLQTDGGKYTSNAFQAYLSENGVIQPFYFFCPDTHLKKWSIRTQTHTLG